MGIHLKILLAFILCFGLTAGISLTALQRSMDASHDIIEHHDIGANMERVVQSFEASAASLKNQTNDWAVWNEMYRYAINPNPAWEKENIDETTLAPADLTMVMVFARNGRLLSFNALDPETMKPAMLSPRMSPVLEAMKTHRRQAQCGIIRIGERLMLTCWAGIIQSDGDSEVVGTVIMGRQLDPTRLSKLREQTRLSFELTASTEKPDGLTQWIGEKQPGTLGSGDFWTAFNADFYHLYLPVQDVLGQEVGLISLEVPRTVHKQGVVLYEQVRQQLAWTLAVLTVMLGLMLHFMLIRRLRRFAGEIHEMENQSSWDARISVGGRDELGVVASNFNKLVAIIKSQMEGLKEALLAKDQAIEVIQATQAQLIRSEKAALLVQRRVSNLLDNSGEGYLSFGADLVIDPEVSRACEAMLGVPPAGRNAAQLLGQGTSVGVDLFRDVVHAIDEEADPTIRESMLSLLPAEIERESVLLKADYKLIEDGRFMVVLSDITEARRLQTMLQKERERLEFIVSAVTDRRNFVEATGAFRGFLTSGLPHLLSHENASKPGVARQVLRELHTYKGVLGQLGFTATPHAIHDAETRLSQQMSREKALAANDIAAAVSPASLQSCLDDELSVLTAVLADDFLGDGERIVLPGSQLIRLEQLATRLLRSETVDATDPEVRALLDTLATVHKVTLNKVLADFGTLVKRTASRLGKEVAPIEVVGGESLWLARKPYQAFFHTLGHVFRNAVAHGLETPEERWAAGKDERGNITCHVALQNDLIRLSIADDGAGIDPGTLRERAVAVNLYTADEVRDMTDEEVLRLIFCDRMSTREQITEFAGRGVGLAAVLEETRKLGGDVIVASTPGHGTCFTFSLPLQQSSPDEIACEPAGASLEFVMQTVVNKTRHYFEKEHEVEVAATRSEVGALASMKLLDLTAMISLGGRINLHVAFSFEQTLVNAVCDWMTAGFNEQPDTREAYREAAVGEVINTILGHCTRDLQHLDREGISMTPPVVIARVDAIHGLQTPMFFTQHLETTQGCLSISLVGPKNVFSTSLGRAE